MKHVTHPTLKVIARWPDDKFNRFRPYLRQQLSADHYSQVINMRASLKQEQQLTTAYVNFTLAEWFGYEDDDLDEWS